MFTASSLAEALAAGGQGLLWVLLTAESRCLAQGQAGWRPAGV